MEVQKETTFILKWNIKHVKHKKLLDIKKFIWGCFFRKQIIITAEDQPSALVVQVNEETPT